MSIELKPCPFCGSEAKLLGSEGAYWAHCSSVKCDIGTMRHSTLDEIELRWNRRTFSGMARYLEDLH